jgi:predicted nucleic acid-binding protein
MKVLVDTSVWSLALRRRTSVDHRHVDELRELVHEGRVAIVGPIRQELLSGVRDRPIFERLRRHLQAFPDLAITTEDHERAAEHCNACRARGLQGSNTDFLLCAVAERHALPILTTDDDFLRFARILPMAIHTPRTRLTDA